MQNEGPPLQHITHRLAECPPDFLAEPRQNGRGGKIVGEVVVAAVVGDLLLDLSAPVSSPNALMSPVSSASLDVFASQSRNHAQLVLIACWVFHDDWFLSRANLDANANDANASNEIEYSMFANGAWRLLSSGLDILSQVVEAPLFISDADRREELARLCLAALNLRPLGETSAQSQSRLTTLDSIERQRVVLETRAAQQRAQNIREAMQEKARQEAAARYTRE